MKAIKHMRVEGIRIKPLSIEQYLNTIMLYLKELINNHKAIKNGSK